MKAIEGDTEASGHSHEMVGGALSNSQKEYAEEHYPYAYERRENADNEEQQADIDRQIQEEMKRDGEYVPGGAGSAWEYNCNVVHHPIEDLVNPPEYPDRDNIDEPAQDPYYSK